MNRAQIVLIEDNPGDVYLIEMALKDAGIDYDLTRFETAAEAAELLCEPRSETSGSPDVILMDLNTPRSNGFDVLAQLTASSNLARVPIAVFTSSRASSDRNTARRFGVRYVEKPSQLQEFLSVVGKTVSEMLTGHA